MTHTKPKNIKLYVDDLREAPKGWTLVTTVTQAIRVIFWYGADIKEISLDHDISHQVKVGELARPYPCGETFQAVAYFIKTFYTLDEHKPDITIHTANPVGAEALEGILEGFNVEIKMMKPANKLESHE